MATRKFQIGLGLLLCIVSFLGLLVRSINASGLYYQMVLSFPDDRQITHEYTAANHTLTLQFAKTSPVELESLQTYDERLIRRVLLKDLGPVGTEVKLTLRDPKVRALVTKFKDPFRLTIDFFDEGFAPEKDPITGIPLAEVPITTSTRGGKTLSSDAKEPALLSLGRSPRAPASEDVPGEDNGTKRQLLQPMPTEFANSAEFKQAVDKAQTGPGRSWATYPIYIYRAQLAPYELSDENTLKNLVKQAHNQSQVMADYAGKLFDFGHEGRALIAYQQVLLKDPSLFEKSPVHLWKFSEAHLGQGNLTLADSYYQSFIEKNPSHPLTKLAQLRRLDIQAIHAIQSGSKKPFPQLLTALQKVKFAGFVEGETQAQIRLAYWSPEGVKVSDDRYEIPLISEDNNNHLIRLLPQVESQKTAFLASSLLLNRFSEKSVPWNKDTGSFVDAYFKKFSGTAAEPIRGKLSERAKAKLAFVIHDLYEKNLFPQVVQTFDDLPESLKSIRKDKDTAWAVGESYRHVSYRDKAIPLYDAVGKDTAGVEKFKALFWTAYLAGQEQAELAKKPGASVKVNELKNLSARSDRALMDTWKELRGDERNTLLTGMRQPLEEAVASDVRLRSPPSILLESWTNSVGKNPPKMMAAEGNTTNPDANFSPSASTVRLIADLNKKFAELGMTDERRRSLLLLRNIKPASFAEDEEARKIWSQHLKDLAEEYRKSNEYLEAGRTYMLLGSEEAKSEDRAETLYKSGLLLFRAGKREEAMAAFEKASGDGNNLFYANLAKERLNQLRSN